MGGPICAEFTATFPERVKKVAMLAPAAYFGYVRTILASLLTMLHIDYHTLLLVEHLALERSRRPSHPDSAEPCCWHPGSVPMYRGRCARSVMTACIRALRLRHP